MQFLPSSQTRWRAQYVSRLLELESMREWYAAALKEPWSEEQFERGAWHFD